MRNKKFKNRNHAKGADFFMFFNDAIDGRTYVNLPTTPPNICTLSKMFTTR